ncbi:MAG: hypothetical protein QXO21_03910 [Candidatus Anstonellales archaeon]
MSQKSTFSHHNGHKNVGIIKIGGKLALANSDYPKRTASKIFQILKGKLPVCEKTLTIIDPHMQAKKELNIFYSHSLQSGSRFVSLNEKLLNNKSLDLSLCVVGCGPQLNNYINSSKVNGIRKFTPWELMAGKNGLAQKVFYEQAAKVIYDQLVKLNSGGISGTNNEWTILLTQGHALLKGDVFRIQGVDFGATGYPYALTDKNLLTIKLNHPKNMVIVLSSTSSYEPEYNNLSQKNGINEDKNRKGIPLNTNSDLILDFFAKYYMQQSSNVYAFVFMLKEELDMLFSNPEVKDGMYLKMQVLAEMAKFYELNVDNKNNTDFRIFLVGI